MTARRRIAPRDRRALLVGVTLLAPVLLVRGVVQPCARSRATLVGRLETQRALLARERALLAGRRAQAEHDAHVAAALTLVERRLFPGGDALAATAAFVAYVGSSARASRVQLLELQGRSAAPLATGEGLVRLQVELRGQGDFDGVLRFLQALEHGPRLVRIDVLAIDRGSAAARGAETLMLRVALSGYVAGSPASAAGRIGL